MKLKKEIEESFKNTYNEGFKHGAEFVCQLFMTTYKKCQSEESDETILNARLIKMFTEHFENHDFIPEQIIN